MINKLKKLLGLHYHDDWSPWEVQKVTSNTYGVYIIMQTRTCKTCGYTQFDKQTL